MSWLNFGTPEGNQRPARPLKGGGRASPKGRPVRATLRDERNTLGQRDLATNDSDQRTPFNPPTEMSSGYLATSSAMTRSVVRAGMRTANLAEDTRAGTPVDGSTRRFQGQVGDRPKMPRQAPRELAGQAAWQEYQAMRSADTGPGSPRLDVSAGGERGLIDYMGSPRVGMTADQSGATVPATPTGRVPWLTKDYVRENASLYQHGWPAFNTHFVAVHPLRYIYARFRGGYPARGLKSVSGVLAQQGAGEASRAHVPAIFVPQP